MHSLGVVEALDVGKDHALGLLSGGKAATVGFFNLQTVPEALHRRVIKAIACATHRWPVAQGEQVILRLVRGILTAAVAVKDEAVDRAFGAKAVSSLRHSDGLGHQALAHMGIDRPAHDFSREQIEHAAGVEPTLGRPQIGDVREPDLIGRAGVRLREILPEQVGGNRQRVRRIGGGLVFAAGFGFEPEALHGQANALVAARVAVRLTQCSVDSRRAVFAFECGINTLHQRLKRVALDRMGAGRARHPGVIARLRDREHAADRGQREGFHQLALDEGVLHRLSFAKYAAAFFKIAFSIFRRESSLRMRLSSACSGETLRRPASCVSLPAS